ncbi:MAG: flagellar export chaperone FliS [Anaerovibrio sp.]|nr:flagellar export chaperone FliS [Selenomonadaceae bacterium]MDY6053736.1 flagellar export chaperone FliS [Anaerovibrio sp.]
MINNAAEAYKRQQVMTATPEALTLMLYNGALRFMKEGMDAMEKKDYEQCNTSLQKAQKIIMEFQATLKMEYEISHQLMPLYDYVYNSLVEANMKSNPAKVQESIDLIKELRDAWAEAMKKARQERGAS